MASRSPPTARYSTGVLGQNVPGGPSVTAMRCAPARGRADVVENGVEVFLPNIERRDERAVGRDALQGRSSEGAAQAVDLVSNRAGHHESDRQPASGRHWARLGRSADTSTKSRGKFAAK